MSEDTVYKAQEKVKLNGKSSPAPWILIGLGVFLLLASILEIHLIDYLWPGFVIVPGLLLMYPAYKSTAETRGGWSFLAVPGAIFLAAGAQLFVMNLFDHFEAWAYSWPLLAAAAAGGVLYLTRFDDNARLQQRAHKFIRLMVMLTTVLALFFEIIIFENFNPLMSLGLIAIGFYLLLRDRRSGKSA